MINVWCVCVGDKYDTVHVENLYRMVKANFNLDFNFTCLTDRYRNISVPQLVVDGCHGNWWDKLKLFKYASGRINIYFDLDVIITGNITYLAEYGANALFSAPRNWAQSGHGGIQSSVMVWDGRWKEPYERFDYDRDSKRLHGDQCFLTELLGDNFLGIDGVKSYKYHCREGLPEDTRVVCFHGKPDYWEVKHDWIDKALA